MRHGLVPGCRRILAAVVLTLACSASQSSMPGSLPLRKEAESPDTGLWLPAVVLLALLGVAGGIAVWQRGAGALTSGWKRPAREARRGPDRLSSLVLTPQASVHVVQWQGEELLIGCTAQQVTVLCRRERPAEGDTP